MHWPVPMNPNGNHPMIPKLEDGSRDLDMKEWSHVKTYKEMEKLLKTGKTKAIGVSNYSVKFLEELLPHVEVTPAANQIENHPYCPQQDIVDFCKSKGILVEAYSPLGSTGSPLFQEEGVQEVAKKHNVGPGTILISYQGNLMSLCRSPTAVLTACVVSKGNCALPKSVTPARIESNLQTVKLDSTDMESLEGIHKKKGITRFVYPEFGVRISILESVIRHRILTSVVIGQPWLPGQAISWCKRKTLSVSCCRYPVLL